MKLEKITFIQNKDTPEEWQLDNWTLGNINLIVGENAVGKSKTLRTISNLVYLLFGMFRQEMPINLTPFYFDIHFSDENKKINYILQYQEGVVFKEELIEDGKSLLNRKSDGTGKIKARDLEEAMPFKLPKNVLTVVSKRDEIQHSFLEKLHEWSHSVHYFKFGTNMRQTKISIHDSVILTSSLLTSLILLRVNLCKK